MPPFRFSFWTALLLLVFGLAAAAAGIFIERKVSLKLDRRAISATAVPMTAEVGLRKAHACSSLSPPLKVTGLPTAASKVTVEVTDLNFLFEHGGDTIPAPADGNIPEGALGAYFGPCPDEGEHSYRFRVNALDDAGKIIGIAEVVRPCCAGLP